MQIAVERREIKMHTIVLLGIQTHHDKNFVVKREGSPNSEWVILCFSTPCMVQTVNGLEKAQPGDCFIKSPSFIEYHYTPKDSEEGFINDWLHIRSDSIEDELQKIHLPINMLIRTLRPDIIRGSCQRILHEKQSLPPFYEAAIDNQVSSLLIRIARGAMEYDQGGRGKYAEELLRLRREIQDTLHRQWTIQSMAAAIGLSSNRFSVLYKLRFGVTPNEDLIQMRLEKAKVLLLSTNLKLSDISRSCGFKNEYYFSRMFKDREHISPGAFRRWE